MNEEADLLDQTCWPFWDNEVTAIAVAVSGGGDSMALLDLMRQNRKGHEVVPLYAVTVDHGLRPDAKEEIALVAEYCAEHNILHQVLSWEWDGAGNLQASARAARYRLISAWAQDNDISHIALAHTRDDVAETFLMRLARASGVDGLAAMPDAFQRGGVAWVRPLLRVGRQDLRDFLHRAGLPWAEDPSNSDDRFDRARLRKLMPELAAAGVTPEAIAQSAFHLAEARSALSEQVAQVAKGISQSDRGDVVLDWTPARPAEINRRLMLSAILWVSGAEYGPREAALPTAMRVEGEWSATVHGCLLSFRADPDQRRVIYRVAREYNAVKDLTCPSDQLWDGRWVFDGPHAPELKIRALSEAGLAEVKAQGIEWRDSGLPRASLMSSPAIWRESTLISAPIAGFLNGWTAKLAPARGDFATWLIRR